MRHIQLAVGLMAVALAASALAEPNGRLAMATERLIVFKDGHCLVVRKGVATTDEQGRLYTDEVPDAAVLGTFWATPTEGRLASMRAGWVEAEDVRKVDLPCIEAIEILKANLGQTAQVTVGDKEVFHGTILTVLTRATESALTEPQRRALGLPEPPTGATQTLTGIEGDRFVLRTEDGDQLIHIGAVRGLRVKDMVTTLPRTITTRHRTKRLWFTLDAPATRRELFVIYFRPGIRWIPTYRVELAKGEEKLADVSLQAELLDEAEDFENTRVSLVVGVPNFRFKDVPSPLVLESTMRNALAQAVPVLGGNRHAFSNAMYSQRSSEFRREAIEAADQPAGGADLPPELTGAATQDLYVYDLPPLSMKKGERTAVPIFRARVPYRDVYTWDLSVTRTEGDGPGADGQTSPLRLSTNTVWHQIALTNNTTMPWTTGAAMLMEGGQPLGQELLTYTSPKDEVRIPVTVAIDVRGTFTEAETARELRALQWGGNHYAKVGKQATLAVCNHKRTPITLEITCQLGGRVEVASDKGAVVLSEFNSNDWSSYSGHPSVNNHSTVRWTVELAPGAVVERTVRYHYFLRH